MNAVNERCEDFWVKRTGFSNSLPTICTHRAALDTRTHLSLSVGRVILARTSAQPDSHEVGGRCGVCGSCPQTGTRR